MNVMSYWRFIAGAFVALVLISLTFVMVFGVIESKASISAGAAGINGDRAAASFAISNLGGRFGEASKQELENQITDNCRLPGVKGFGSGGPFQIFVNPQTFTENDCYEDAQLHHIYIESESGQRIARDTSPERLLSSVKSTNQIVETPLYSPVHRKIFHAYVISIEADTAEALNQ